MPAHPDTKEVTTLVRSYVPDADDAIVDYIVGYLDDTSGALDEEDAIADFVRPILLEVGGDDERINELCSKLSEMFSQKLQSNMTKRANGLVKLDQPLNMMSQSSVNAAAKILAGSVDLESVGGKRVQSLVDKKKLEKAEQKIKQKLEKRERRSNYEASRLINDKEQSFEDAYRAVNPIFDYTTTKDKVKDIKVENFDISFAGVRILTGANLTLANGRRYGLVGKNGVGKSTLLRTISRREIAIPPHISILHVEQEIVGDDTPALESVLKADVLRDHLLKEENTLSAQLGELENTKDEENKEANERKKEELGTRLREVYAKLQEIEADKAESRAASLLSGLGFSTEKQQWPTKNFSGGWRMRLALARALFCRPDLLLLDEPTNMLDIPAVVWLEKYLQTWPNTLLVVSHDREFLDEVATDILHQHSERLDYYKGNFTQFYTTKEERRKNQLREYENQMQYRQHLQAFIDRWRYNAARASQAQSKIKILEKLPILEKPEDENVVTFRFPDPDQLNPPVLQMDEVVFGYTKDVIILRGVNFGMQLDSRIAVVGPNGAGKSTLLKLLTGQLEPLSGMLQRHGRLRVAYFTQHHIDQLDLTQSAVGFMATNWPGKSEEEYRRHLGSFGITGMTGLQTMRELSGGQKSRVAFACLSLQNPHILILDEPTNHLDMDSIDALQNALRNFGGGVVIVSHDERFINTVCNELWVCDKGSVQKFSGDIKAYKDLIVPKEEP
ncbi:uncharacterized protein VTP21DRAFT_11087 [Calcarisporiella thermophila]|uniref:uncharacterized protein n=1 Tax=Calcarisporiella thermophila TaxID=911321 RepID=UPI003742E528